VDRVATLVHEDAKPEAARVVAAAFRVTAPKTDKEVEMRLQQFVGVLLGQNLLPEAARVLWTPAKFNPKPACSQQVWDLFDSSAFGLIMGAGSMSKSYTMGVRLFLEWLRDPEYTALKVIGPSKEHLEANLFSHLVDLHDNASIELPGKVGELWIGMDRRQQLGSIKGVVVPVGRVKKAARLQGTKRKPRPKPHPEFGDLSRLFIFLDEIENVPGGIWSDIDNLMSNVNELGIKGFKIFGAYNPTNQEDEVGKRAEPVKGWANLDPEKDFRWTSKRGWEVLRLDGERSENVIANRTIFPGLQTRAGLEQIAKNAGGYMSAGYYSMGRGLYPPQGIALTVIPPGMLQKARGEFIWFDTPKAVGSVDLALEGGASAVFTLGKLGLASGVKYPPSLANPQGKTVMFKDAQGRVVPRWGLQADHQFKLEKGDTEKMASQCIKPRRRHGGLGAEQLVRGDPRRKLLAEPQRREDPGRGHPDGQGGIPADRLGAVVWPAEVARIRLFHSCPHS
jgi:hypothetical protein